MGIEIKNESAQPSVWLYGDIGYPIDGITSAEFREALAEIPSESEIDLHINSGGGIYTEGIAIHTNLRQRSGKTNVFIDALAASAASIVAMAGSRIEMAEGSWMMIHEAHAAVPYSVGASELRRAADRLEATNRQIAEIYGHRYRGETPISQLMADETWFSGPEAVDAGLADTVAEAPAVAAALDPDKFGYKRLPVELKVTSLPGLARRESKLDLLRPFQPNGDENHDDQ